MATGSNAMTSPLDRAKWALDQAAGTDDPKQKLHFLTEASILALEQIPDDLKPTLPKNVDRTIQVLKEIKEGEGELAAVKREMITQLGHLQDRVAAVRLGLVDGQLAVEEALKEFESTGEGSIDEMINKISSR